jgi:hypothetical protein
MEYNSQRNKLVIPEYGRNVQKMIEYTASIEDKDKRTEQAKAVVAIMAQLNPQNRDITEYEHKLWDHLFIISDFKLDVDAPYSPPEKEALKHKPERIPYPDRKIKFKHYGRTTELIIDDIVKRDPSEQKDTMIKMLCNFMKMAYTHWNRDSVSDEQIFSDLKKLSDGKIEIPEGLVLNTIAEPQHRNQKSGKKKKRRSHNGGRNRRQHSN